MNHSFKQSKQPKGCFIIPTASGTFKGNGIPVSLGCTKGVFDYTYIVILDFSRYFAVNQ